MNEHKELEDRARQHLMAISWQIPVLARAAASVSVRLTDRVPTMAVDARGRIYISPTFAGELSGEDFRFILCHEILHVLLTHFGRRGGREPDRWNRATDRAINQTLVEMELKAPAMALLPLPNMPKNGSAEELYDLEPEPPKMPAAGGKPGGSDSGGGGSAGAPMPTAGCGVSDSDAFDDEDADGESDGGSSSGRQADGIAATVWRQIAIAAIGEARKSVGNSPVGALIKLLEVPPARVRWADVLKHAMVGAVAGAGRDDVSWSRKSRRGAGLGCVLPGGITTKAAIAVIIDASGSVDDKALGHAVAETCAAVSAAGCPSYLVVHDAKVQWEGWIQPGTRPQRIVNDCLKGRGGTAFRPAYDAVSAVNRRFGTLIHLTDALPCDVWPDKPSNCRKAIVGLIGISDASNVPSYAATKLIESFRDR